MARHSGFTLVEILMAVFFLGAVAMFTVPKIMETTGTQTAYSKAKNMASSIQEAAEKLKEANPSLDMEDYGIPEQIAGQTKYTIIVDDDQKLTTDAKDFTMPECNSATPCYRFADGGILIPYAWFNTEAPQPTAVFLYDPDNTGNISPLTLIMNFETGRIAPMDAYLDGAAYYDSNSANIPAGDPSYIRQWTKL